MEKTKLRNNGKIALAIIALLLVSSALIVFSNSKNITAAATDYGDIMQYEWPILGCDDYNTRFNPGPAPDKPTLLWRSTYGAIYTVFNGMAFSVSGTRLYAVDAFNGKLVWSTTLTHGGSNPNKIDDNYLFVDSTRGVAVYSISDGAYVSHLDVTNATTVGWNNPGGGSYYPGKYSAEMKMKYRVVFDIATNISSVIAISLANPLKPTIAWCYNTDKTSEIMTTGEGKVFIGSYSGYCMYALNGTTGEFLWKSPKIGICGYTALYYNGAVYHAGGTTRLTAYNASTGEILWDHDAGIGHWFAHGIMAAYGRIYNHVMLHLGRPTGVPQGEYVCWDAATGEVLWKLETNYMGGYWTPAVADGKIYAMVIDNSNWGVTNPLQPHTWAAIDAFTGTILWKAPLGDVSNFIVAYGNLYAGTNVIGPKSPEPWSYWRGNTAQPGVAVGQPAPAKLTVKWTYKTGEAVTSSPAVVDGKVYIGSYDQNLYCLDAYTGNLIWKSPTEYEVSSSPAVVGGKVYTGVDDGYIYCLDANKGTQIWKTNIYAGNVPPIQFEIDTAQVRSSPIVIGNKLYVGALDGNVYCLRTSDGRIQWNYTTKGPIGGSPAYSSDTIYIASSDRTLYALDAENGTLKWRWTTPKTATGSRQLFFVGTPTVAEGRVFIGGGGRSVSPTGPIYVALNATTGALIWQVVTDANGNSNQPYALTYYKGVLYGEAHMSAVAFNATNGAKIWSQWIGHQVYSSPAYADDLCGAKVYWGANSYSITCFNASNGQPLSWYTTAGQVYSSPAIYDGNVYVGSVDQNVYCFGANIPVVPTSIWAASNKGAEMWSNETLVIKGRLLGTTSGEVWADQTTLVPVDSSLRPGLPNATVVLSVTKPDMTSVNVTTTTDKKGFFAVSYSPDIVGDWGWVVYYEGQQKPAITYEAAYSEWNPFKVVSAPSPLVVLPSPPPGGAPVEYLYAAVAVIAVVLIAIGTYIYTKRSKK